MSASSGGLGKLFLRYASPLSGLRHVPLVGPSISWLSRKLVPQGSLTWVQVQQGAGQGLWLHLNPRTGRDYFEGRCEPKVQAALQQCLRPGMTFYDVGANMGFFSLVAASIVGKTGRVIAFEPDPAVASRLREHAARNQFQEITVLEKAVGSDLGKAFFARTDPTVSPDLGLGHVIDEDKPGAILVESTTLDEFAYANYAPDFIKCDVEGHEVEVFRGAQRLLAEKQPRILCEMHSKENRRILLEEFKRFGYICKTLDKQHILALPLTAEDWLSEERKMSTNFSDPKELDKSL